MSKKTAFDVLHFFIFTIVEREKGKSSSNQEIPGPKICKLCSYVQTFLYVFCFLMTSRDIYGTDKSAVPRDVPNFIYGPKTANGNLRRHLNKVHAEEYDQAIKQHKWPYQLSSQTQTADASTAHSTRSQRDPRLPQFSQTVFQELLVRFIVADDQVSPDDLAFFSHSHKSSVDSRCGMPRVSTIMYGPLPDSRRRRHPSPR